MIYFYYFFEKHFLLFISFSSYFIQKENSYDYTLYNKKKHIIVDFLFISSFHSTFEERRKYLFVFYLFLIHREENSKENVKYKSIKNKT